MRYSSRSALTNVYSYSILPHCSFLALPERLNYSGTCAVHSESAYFSVARGVAYLTPVTGLIFLPEKVSDSANFCSEFFFPNSILLCSFLGLWSRFINPPLQSLVNQYFSQTFERLFSKRNIKGKALEVDV